MSELSKQQRWPEMAALIDDDVLHEWVVVATYDNLARAMIDRYAGVVDRVEVSIPVETEADRETLGAIVAELAAAD
jgi:hypothetical protein